MAGIRIVETGLVIAFLAGASGTMATARAQASGTLQASVTVIDDAVSRSVFQEVTTGLRNRPGAETAPRPLHLPGDGVKASIIELEPIEGLRRVRVEVLHI